jgi:hypothetical protein
MDYSSGLEEAERSQKRLFRRRSSYLCWPKAIGVWGARVTISLSADDLSYDSRTSLLFGSRVLNLHEI